MARAGFVFRFLKPCAVVALMVLLSACGGRGGSIAPPSIVRQPQSASIAEGGSATFSVVATGDGALIYQWQRNGFDIAGATEATYTAGPETFSESGAQFRVRVSSDGGASVSEPATLTITAVCAGVAPNAGWCQVGPTQVDRDASIRALEAVDGLAAWAFLERYVDGGTSILRTVNGGLNWTSHAGPPTRSYGVQPGSLSAVSATVAWTVQGGAVFKTADGGGTWATIGSFTYAQSVKAINADVAWVEDVDCMQTTIDGGKSWTRILPCFRPRSPDSLSVVGSSVAWAITAWAGQPIAETLTISVDGGRTWSERSLPKTDAEIWALAAIDARTAWVVGNSGVIFKTTDGGVSWVQQPSGIEGQLNYVRAIDANTVWAGGSATLRSVDGGAAWSQVGSGGSSLLRAVNASTAWQTPYGGTISRTADSGATWIVRAWQGFASPQVASAKTVWGSVGGDLVRTTNGGGSWTPITPPAQLSGFAVAGEDAVWTLLGKGTGTTWMGLTQDAGQHWRLVDSQVSVLPCVTAIDATTAWFAGVVTLQTTDSGSTWSHCGGIPVIPGAYGPRVGLMTASSSQILWAAGAQTLNTSTTFNPQEVSFLAKSEDGCSHWTLTAMPPVKVVSMAVVDAQMVWIAGYSASAAEIYKTEDGGATWTRQYSIAAQYSITGPQLIAIAAADRYTAWSVGREGTILSTVDGGATWTTQPSGTVANLYHITAFNRRIAWIAGNGVLLKTTTGGD